jgi:hypothetical protein
MSRTANVKRRTKPLSLRDLVEQIGVGAPNAPALKIDRDAGIIYGVKVVGRYSRNNHGLTEAENGSEYSPACLREALPMYEELKVRCNHPADRTKPGAERDVDDTFGVLKGARIESEDDGIRADLHYFKSHPMAERVLEDIERKLGVWGLSHNASAARERFDRAGRRLVIESLAKVRSADLVDKPATNRNLWESERTHMNTTLRELLESRRKDWSKPRRLWANVLLEDEMTAPMDAPVTVDDGGDEEDALWSGFQAAIQKVMDSYKSGEMDAKEAGKKIMDWLKAHDKLTGSEEPEAPSEGGEGSGSGEGGEGGNKTESEEVVTLRAEKAARQLCESLGFAPTELQVEAIAGLKSDKRRRELAESYKPTVGGGSKFKSPKSAAPGTVKPGGDRKKPTDRETVESEVVPAADGLRVLMGD